MAKLPDMIDKYKVDALLAQGGMGEVYTAVHPTLNCKVIIKKLTLKGNRDINERFKREAKLMMDFRHEQIVDMYDHFKLGSNYYLVLEFVDGISLEKMIKNCRYLDSAVAAYILLRTAEALHYAHTKKVVHRDIKPANILLSKKGEVKLADFGIASSGETEDEGLTREGMTLGTPGYMAPEQFKDTRNVDFRADVYALGVMAYEMLTGKKPFPGSFSAELMSRIQTGKYKNPKRLNPRIAPQLATFIRRSMKVNPRRRFQTMAQGIALLKKYLRNYDLTSLKKIVADAANGREPGKPVLKSAVNKARKIVPVIFLPVREKTLHSFRSLPVYLPEGAYRCKLTMEDEVYWSAFVILPRTLQKRNPVTRKGLYLTTGYPVPMTRPVSVFAQVRDALTGESLDDPSRIRILDDGEWRRLEKPEILPVGSEQSFRVECDGYTSEVFDITITGRESVLVLKASLIPDGAVWNDKTGRLEFEGRADIKKKVQKEKGK